MSTYRQDMLGLWVTSGACIVGAIGAAVAATATLGPIAGPLVAAAMTQAGAYGINRISSRVDKAETNLQREQEELQRGTRNADVHRLMGRAIALTLRLQAQASTTNDGLRPSLRKLAAAVDKAWSQLAEHETPLELQESNVSAFFDHAPQEVKAQPVLSTGRWQNVLAPIAAIAPVKFTPEEWQLIGENLTHTYAKALYAVTKTAAIDNDPAWPGLLLRLLAEQREVIDSIDATVTQLRLQVGNQSEHLHDIKDALARLEATRAPAMQFAAHAAELTITALTALLNQKDARDNARYQSLFELMLREFAGLRLFVSSLWTKLDRLPAEQASAMAALAHLERTARGQLWTIPPLPTNRIGRPALVTDIRNALQGDGKASLSQAMAHAGGGFGKSVAAALYAHEYGHAYPGGCVWIDAAAEDANERPLAPEAALLAVARGLADLADKLNIPEERRAAEAAARKFANPDKQLAAACAVAAALESACDGDGTPQRVLLVLDNISDPAHWTHEPLQRLLPRRNVHILATTRRERLGQCRPVKVDKLSPRESVNLLAQYLPESDAVTPARSIAANLGISEAELDLPPEQFAATQARWGPVLHLAAHVEYIAVYVAAIGAYLRNTPGATWAAYWQDVQHDALEAIPAGDAAVSETIGYARHLHKILADAIHSLPQPEQVAMQYAAYLPPRGFPAFWLAALLQADTSITLASVKGVPGGPAQAVLAHLLKLDMLRGALDNSAFISPHRVYAAFARHQLDTQPDRRRAVLDAIIDLGIRRGKASHDALAGPQNIKDEGARVQARDALRAELTPLKDLAGVLDQAGEAEAGLSIANWLNTPLKGLGRFADGYDTLHRFLRPDRHWDDKGETTQHGAGHSNLALIQLAQGDLPAARASMERAIAIAEKNLGAEHPNLGTMRSNLATIQQDQGDLPAARASMEWAITIDSKYVAPDHPTFANRYSNLAMIQRDQGDLPAARASMERAIAIAEKHLGAEHPSLGTMRSNLAMIQKAQGNLPAALASMERAIAIDSKHFAIDHPTFATRYSNLATIQQDQGDLPAARASMERAIAIDLKHFAPGHPTFANRYNNLAAICYAEGDRTAACANLQKALAIFLKHFDENHPHVQRVRRNMKNAGCPPGT
ncbi:MAG TPA: tetratricopeptide repeat protein [Phycisphaerales bacterium]|nr:tetratricopeptide repeat protein [Phycisphaerales bacterium]